MHSDMVTIEDICKYNQNLRKRLEVSAELLATRLSFMILLLRSITSRKFSSTVALRTSVVVRIPCGSQVNQEATTKEPGCRPRAATFWICRG